MARIRRKVSVGQRYGLLTVMESTDKRDGTAIIWRCRCDCGNIVERSVYRLNDNSGCLECRPRWASLRKDYTGQRFGRLTALECTGQHKGKELVWRLQCDCGNTVELPVSRFIGGNTQSCGCLKKIGAGKNSPNYQDLIGKRFGMLTVEAEDHDGTTGKRVKWLCRCDCGNTIIATTSQLNEGDKRSCGCINARLYCVFKHVSPDGRVYIGTTSRLPRKAWFSGNRYRNQAALHEAIEQFGGEAAFRTEFHHFYFTPGSEWKELIGSVPFEETNLFSCKDAETLKRQFISEYHSLEPEYGFNAASGGLSNFHYTDATKERQSNTHSGRDGRNDWCVYIHTNIHNGKKYVGITCQPPKVRWSHGNGYKRPPKQGSALSHFYKAIQKYGWDSFEHEIYQTGLTKDQAIDFEKQLIATLETTNPQKGYNETKGGDGAEGVIHTPETKEKLSKLARDRAARGMINFKGQHHSEETKALLSERAKERYRENPESFFGKRHTDNTKKTISQKNSQPVNQYSLNGDFIKQYPSGIQAAKDIGVSLAALNDAALGKTRFCGGFIWRKSKNAPPVGEPIDAAAIIGSSNHYGQKKSVDQLTMDGEFIHRFNSLTEAAAAVGGTVANISAAAWGRGHTKSCKGYKWRFSED